ncbi:Transcription factor IIA [Babesia duncani]|uniref:Transcription factor IIA n=1 Tax=Babesia duncani TaxID=323732 RepID=A0AAD9UQ75_9APIC|nr:Transcription factor IIA [Babesia duncani]
MNTNPTELQLDVLNEQIIKATIDKCAHSHDPRILNAIKHNWIQVLKKRMGAVESSRELNTIPPVVENEIVPAPVDTVEPVQQEEDEFSDAEVESAPHLHALNEEFDNKEETPKPEESSSQEDSSDVSISDISDLDDFEPESKDLVIGLLDKISRPSSKKSGTPIWRLKLKYGILQINGVEVPFDVLEGEFEF